MTESISHALRLRFSLKTIILALFFLTFGTFQAYAAISGQQLWAKQYTGPGAQDDFAQDVAIDSENNVYVTGSSVGLTTGSDFTTIKYGPGGGRKWVKRYNGPDNSTDTVSGIAVDGSGNAYVTGTTQGSSTGSDFTTIKYSPGGVRKWIKRYNGPANGDDLARAVAVDGNGNVYVTGTTPGSSTGADYTTIKYDPAGVRKWVKRYNGPGNGDDWARAMTVDSRGNVCVTGTSIGLGTGFDYATIKYDPAGVRKWVKRYNGPGDEFDVASFISVDGNDNVYVGGSSAGNTSGDYATIKYDPAGVRKWVKRYNGPGDDDDTASAMSVDSSGNAYVTGASNGSGAGVDYVTLKYGSDGGRKWIKRYNGPANGDDLARAVGVDGSGNAYVTGWTPGSRTGADYTTIKYDPAGVRKWVKRYNGPGNGDDGALAIALDSGNVYVTGASWGSGTGYDYATVKYAK